MIDTATLAERIGGQLEGESRLVTGLAEPGSVRPGALVVAGDAAALSRTLATRGAASLAAIVVGRDVQTEPAAPPLIRHAHPRYALALVTAELDPEPSETAGIAATAQIDPSAEVGTDVRVAHGAVVGAGAQLGDGVSIGPGAVVGDDCRIGAGSRLFARVVLYPRVRLGARVRVHAGAVLGTDGFGYVPGPRGAAKIHHLGRVRIGDDVEIGANTSIERGTLADTVVGDGSKMGDLCLIAHNVQIGRHCLIVGDVAVGGSTVIEDGVHIGGGTALTDHIHVGTGARIAGRAGVSKNVPAGETWAGLPAAPIRTFIRERYLIGRLERIWAFVRSAGRSDRDEGR